MKRGFLFLLIFYVSLYGQRNVSISIGANNLYNTFTYKGTKNKFSDIGIDKLHNIAITSDIKTLYKYPDIYINLAYFTSFSQDYTLTKDITVDNTTFNQKDNINSKFYFTKINLAGYYTFLKTNTSTLNIGAGLYGITGSLKIYSNTKYSKIDFDFYYPGLYTDYQFNKNNYRLGINAFSNLNSDDWLYTVNIYGKYKFKKFTVGIGLKKTKIDIENYDSWYSDITTSGVYLEIGKKF